MTTESKESRLAAQRERVSRAKTRITMALAREDWREIAEYAQVAEYATQVIRGIEAEPAETNVVGRRTVEG